MCQSPHFLYMRLCRICTFKLQKNPCLSPGKNVPESTFSTYACVVFVCLIAPETIGFGQNQGEPTNQSIQEIILTQMIGNLIIKKF